MGPMSSGLEHLPRFQDGGLVSHASAGQSHEVHLHVGGERIGPLQASTDVVESLGRAAVLRRAASTYSRAPSFMG